MKAAMDTITAAARTDIDLARPKAASDSLYGHWLHAAPIASVGQRLGARACTPTPVFMASCSTPWASMAYLTGRALQELH